ncbi:MAG: GNAT family N-acetyltransferase, partial [Myxococcota bacterium]
MNKTNARLGLLQPIVSLRTRALEQLTLLQLRPQARDAITEYATSCLGLHRGEDAIEAGDPSEVELFRVGDEVRAHVTAFRRDTSITALMVDHRLGDEEAIAWTQATLSWLIPELDEPLEIELTSAYRHLLPSFAQHGIVPKSVTQIGTPDRTLHRFLNRSSKADVDRFRLPEGYALQIQSETHLGEVLRLRDRVGYETRHEVGECARSEAMCWVVLNQEQVVGYVKVHVRDDPYWGRTAELDLVLAPEHWKSSLLGAAYERALRAAVQTGAECVRNRTSQPETFKLGHLCSLVVETYDQQRIRAFDTENTATQQKPHRL